MAVNQTGLEALYATFDAALTAKDGTTAKATILRISIMRRTNPQSVDTDGMSYDYGSMSEKDLFELVEKLELVWALENGDQIVSVSFEHILGR